LLKIFRWSFNFNFIKWTNRHYWSLIKWLAAYNINFDIY
jgi:hypothetical protein